LLTSRFRWSGTRRADRSASLLRARGKDGEGLPQGWQAFDDPKSGKKYYYNETTDKTQWEKPGSEVGSPGRSEEELESMEARLGIGRKGRDQLKSSQAAVASTPEGNDSAVRSPGRRQSEADKVVWKEGSLTPEGWDEMDVQKKVVEGLWGEKGLLYWLNYLSYRLIFVMIGGWILFRFVGPALNIYQLTNPFDLSNVPL